jgi:hypothetical protein
VLLVGTTLGAAADKDGRFEFDVPSGSGMAHPERVLVTFIGFGVVTHELAPNQAPLLRIELHHENVELMGELIITRPPWHKRLWYYAKRSVRRAVTF